MASGYNNSKLSTKKILSPWATGKERETALLNSYSGSLRRNDSVGSPQTLTPSDRKITKNVQRNGSGTFWYTVPVWTHICLDYIKVTKSIPADRVVTAFKDFHSKKFYPFQPFWRTTTSTNSWFLARLFSDYITIRLNSYTTEGISEQQLEVGRQNFDIDMVTVYTLASLLWPCCNNHVYYFSVIE